jgi:hypothetical protein
VLHRLLARAEEGHLAVRQDEHVVEQAEHLIAGLEQRCQHRGLHVGQQAHGAQDVVRSRGVEAGRGLVEQEDGGVLDGLDADRDALLFAAGHAAQERVTDHGVGPVREAQHLQDGVDAHLLLLARKPIPHLTIGTEPKRLLDRQLSCIAWVRGVLVLRRRTHHTTFLLF